jgi:hypothetical protein
MHPMFVKLYLENGADDMLAEEEDRRRAANRSRRARARETRLASTTGLDLWRGSDAAGPSRDIIKA